MSENEIDPKYYLCDFQHYGVVSSDDYSVNSNFATNLRNINEAIVDQAWQFLSEILNDTQFKREMLTNSREWIDSENNTAFEYCGHYKM